MEKDRNLAPLLIILVVLLVAVAGYLTMAEKWGALLSRVGLNASSTPVLSQRAQVGRLVEGFPAEYVNMVSDANILESGVYEGVGERGVNVLYAKYETKAKLSDMFAAYVNYFTDHGLSLTGMSAQSGITAVSAKGDGWAINVKMYVESARINNVEVRAEKVAEDN